ncbi:hypothetical protein LOF24_28000 [Sinorhizobium meliloti SM11]|uniref:Uncharacterized protein n=1 Tax=Sinorhizobium meliloti (strain SM11) TaxID=707241 RepID=A4KVE6_SINMM|nr:hypothetical protein [Sinorhizobium meliloti]ABN47047.1 hypothetical protein [Sinorhizobium meliloti SM11]MDE4561848.1 hypothetical protein [Sinorhizobium meliloti SM11]
MFTYDPPARIDDLPDPATRAIFLDDWHKWMSHTVHAEIQNLQSDPADNVPSPLFFSEVDRPAQKSDLPVTWNAFPLSVARQTASDPAKGWVWLDGLSESTRYSVDKNHLVKIKQRRQDEYCEWRRDDKGPRGPRYVFTAEGPEYWIMLAKHDLDRVTTLYQKYVSPDVRKEDLLLKNDIRFGEWILKKGSYDPFNTWNTEKGILHLTQGANTLGAEVNLAARATVLRSDMHGQRIVDARRLIGASGYGSINRSSDPNIGFGLNITAVPAGAVKPLSITLANPVGLYMSDIAEGRLTDANDQPLVGWFKFVRGQKGHGLMAVLEPPAGEKRTLDDVYVDGEKLQSGGQVATLIQMVVYAATADLGTPMSPLRPPAYRACAVAGTDLTNLAQTNLDVCDVTTSCGAFGHDMETPVELVDAYPEIFSEEAPAAIASTATRRLTRNA